MTIVNGIEFDKYSATGKWLIAEMAGALDADPGTVEITFNYKPIDIEKLAKLIDNHVAREVSNNDAERLRDIINDAIAILLQGD